MRLFVLFGLLTLLIVPTYAQDDSSSDAPYLYYYSNVLKGIVIERADGTDSRVLGHGLVDENVRWTRGPGWSADGTWFAWHVESPGFFYSNVGKGYAVNVQNGMTLDILADFPCIHRMLWHPTENILFVQGVVIPHNQTDCPDLFPSPVTTYWLVDVETNTIMSRLSMETQYGNLTNQLSRIYWLEEQQQGVAFTELTLVGGEESYRAIVIEMRFDGRVFTEIVPPEERAEHFSELTFDQSPYQDDLYHQFTHWFEHPEERVEGVPPAIEYDGWTVAGQWDPSREWLLVGHEFCRADCSGVTEEVSVFNPASGSSREISDCGGHPSCIGWLPERIDVDALLPGRPNSVLPTPVSIDYTDDPNYSRPLSDVMTHEITCNQQSWRRESVINPRSGETDFVLPNAISCQYPPPGENHDREMVVFALSSDNAYFAITDESKYTSLYDAETGTRIAMLNFYGEELSFSETGRFLITTSTSATATWDVQDLITSHGD